MNGPKWTDKELTLLDTFFSSKQTLRTLAERIFNLSGRSYEAVARKVRREKKLKPSEQFEKSLRVGYFDIEATHLKADFGYILCWYIKVAGQNKYYWSMITKEEIFSEQFDRRVVTELFDAFSHFDILYTHYGSDWRFDLPFCRSRAYMHNLEHLLPQRDEKFIRDTYPIAKKKLKFRNNRLATIAEGLGIRNVKKTPLDGKIWMTAAVGNPKSLEYIALHNKRDVQVLERVHNKLKCVEKPVNQSM